MSTERSEVELHVRPSAFWKLCGQVLLVAGALYLISRVAFVVAWVLVALVLALALEPAVVRLERRGLKRGLAIAIVMGLVVGLLVALGATLVPLLVEQARAFFEAAPTWIDRLRASEAMAWATAHLGLVDAVRNEVATAATAAAGSAVALVQGVLYGLAATITVIALTVFMLLFGPAVARATLEWVEPARREHVVSLAVQMQRSVGGYVAGALVVATVGGVVTAVAMLALGIPYYVPLGLLMVVLGLIPYIGPVIGGVLVSGAAFLSSGVTAGLVMLGVFVVYQQIENHLLQPLVQRHTIKMNPLLIALAMLVGTASAGVIGAVLALPIAGAVQVIAESALARRQQRWAGASPTQSPMPALAPSST